MIALLSSTVLCISSLDGQLTSSVVWQEDHPMEELIISGHMLHSRMVRSIFSQDSGRERSSSLILEFLHSFTFFSNGQQLPHTLMLLWYTASLISLWTCGSFCIPGFSIRTWMCPTLTSLIGHGRRELFTQLIDHTVKCWTFSTTKLGQLTLHITWSPRSLTTTQRRQQRH